MDYPVEAIEFPLNLLIITIGSFLSVSLAVFLLFSKSSKSLANIFLGGLVLCLFLFFITAFLYRFHLLWEVPHFIFLQRLTHPLFGPLAYFFVLASIQKGFIWKPKMFIPFIPFIIYFAIHFGTFFQSGEAKINFYYNLILTGDHQQSKWVFILSATYSSIYYVLGVIKLFEYRRYVVNNASTIDEGYHRWVLVFIGILGASMISILIFGIADYNHSFIQMMYLCFFVFLIAIYTAALVKPKLFHHFPHQMPVPDSTLDKKQKYESSNLKEDQKQSYIESIEYFVKKNKPYLEPELTLAQLAERVDIPPHYLSQVINEKLDQNFLDYINGYRVKEAMANLVDTKNQNYTIISVAYDSGFNSKSTFYTAFKKATGMTPSQYRKSKSNLLV